MQGRSIRLTSVISILLPLIVQYGCSAHPGRILPDPPLVVKLRTQKVALVSLPVEINTASDLFARSALAGGFKGAATGPLDFMLSTNGGRCTGATCGAVLVIGAAMAMTVGPVIGAIGGVTRATPEEEANRLEQELRIAVDLVATHLDISRQIMAEAPRIADLDIEIVSPGNSPGRLLPDYRALRNSGYGTILEVALKEIQFKADKNDGSLLSLHLNATVRVIDSETLQVVFEKEVRRDSPFANWSKKEGPAVLQILDENVQGLAQDIVDNVFKSVSLPLSSHYWAFPGTRNFGWCWLDPVDPQADYQFWGAKLRLPVVASRQPTLSFRPFPTEEQAAEFFQAFGENIDGVTYDIRIWQPQTDSVPRIVYEHYGFKGPSHTVEQPLEYSTEYYWSMRACFPYQKISICTPWAFSSIPSSGFKGICYETTIPLNNYYRFTTPGGMYRWSD